MKRLFETGALKCCLCRKYFCPEEHKNVQVKAQAALKGPQGSHPAGRAAAQEEENPS